MGKEFRDGIILDNKFFIKDEKRQGFSVLARTIQILAILIGGFSFSSILRESLNISVNTLDINMVILIFTGILVTFCLLPSYDSVKLFFCILFYGLFFYSRLPRIANGFYLIENAVIDRLASYYGYKTNYFLADHVSEARDMTFLIIMILIPVVALLTIAIVRGCLVKISATVLLLPVLGNLLLGVIPAEKYLIPYVAVFLYLSRSGVSYRNIVNKDQISLLHRVNSRAAVWLSVMCLLLFFILKLFITDKEYNGITQIRNMKDSVQTAFTDFSYEDFTERITKFQIFEKSFSVGGLQGGELGKIGEVKYSNSEQLFVTAPSESVSKGIYLKGYVGSEYNGDRWEEHSKDDRIKYRNLLKNLPKEKFSPVNQTSMLLDRVLNTGIIPADQTGKVPYELYQGNLSIEYKGANKKYIYAPYYTNFEKTDGLYEKQDLYAAPEKNARQYEFNYYFYTDNGYAMYSLLMHQQGQLGDYSEYEKRYRDYVYQVYTKLPAKGLERLKKDFSPKNKLTDITQKIEYVRNYLNKNASYTLSPGRLPKGKDFVEYFLYKNKKGYCSHFASAATLMLRAMGVPARYVEGYVVKPGHPAQDTTDSLQKGTIYSEKGSEQYTLRGNRISVKDSDAHAWVEVYIGGLGWLPQEFTPGASMENGSLANYLEQSGKDRNSSDDKKTGALKVTNQPTPAVEKQSNKERPKLDKSPGNQRKQASSAGPSAKSGQVKTNIWYYLAFFLITAASFCIFILSKTRRKNKIIKCPNYNKRAILLFTEIEKILSACQGLPGRNSGLEDNEEYVRNHCMYADPKAFASCMGIIRKARFGRGSITLNELKEIEVFRKKLFHKVYEKLPFVKKVILRLALFM